MRLVSWNIHGGVGRDGRRDLDRVARVLREARCDAAALQEVGDPHRSVQGEDRSHEVADHAAHLGKLLGWYVAYGPTLVLAGRPYGNAVLSRHPIVRVRNYDLSVRGHEPRGCLRADLDLGGRALHLFNLHLGLSGGERRRQAAMLLSADLLRDAARLAGVRQATWPAKFPLLRLDRAYVDAAIEVLGCAVLESAEARLASDHLPLWMELRPRLETFATAPGPAAAPQ